MYDGIGLMVWQHVHWTELIAGKDKDEGEGSSLSDSERKRREAVWELFKSELVFFLDHLMVIKHVSISGSWGD